jgi:hypothetical protein
LGKEDIKSLYRVDVINVGFRKTVSQESLFILFFFKSGRNYDLMLCFINAMKFCSGGAVIWKDNVQGVLNKSNNRILVLSQHSELPHYFSGFVFVLVCNRVLCVCIYVNSSDFNNKKSILREKFAFVWFSLY